MNDRTAYTNWALSFLAGGVLGAAVALLLTPQSGQETRKAMRRAMRETDESVRRLKDQVVRGGGELRDETQRRVGEVVKAIGGNSSPAVASL